MIRFINFICNSCHLDVRTYSGYTLYPLKLFSPKKRRTFIFIFLFNNHNAYKGTVVHKKGNLKMLHKLY